MACDFCNNNQTVCDISVELDICVYTVASTKLIELRWGSRSCCERCAPIVIRIVREMTGVELLQVVQTAVST